MIKKIFHFLFCDFGIWIDGEANYTDRRGNNFTRIVQCRICNLCQKKQIRYFG